MTEPILTALEEEISRLKHETSKAKPYRILGWCPDRKQIHYQHSETGQIASIRPSAQASSLLPLAPLSHWETCFPSKLGVDWNRACSDIIEAANDAGVFAVDRVRGRGVWLEGKAIVWHLGDRLEVDGREVDLITHRSAHHYPRLPALNIDTTATPLSDAEGREILSAIKAMGWSTPLDPLHLMGWAVLANVGGALDKRPVLQITSRAGSGKTYLRERVLQPLLPEVISGSDNTEAGIRQTLKADTLPVLIDESESENRGRREGHLKLARLSYDGSPTSRGTTHGQALNYAVRSSIAMVGINANITNPADRSRTVVVGREQLPQAQWTDVDRRVRALLIPGIGDRLIRRTVSNLTTLRANTATFSRVVECQLQTGTAARDGDTYGPLLAGAHLLTSLRQLDDQQAVAWLDDMRWSADAALGEAGAEGQGGAAEGRQCLRHLLAHEELWRDDTKGTGKLSIRELVELARSPGATAEAEAARKALGRRGVRCTDMGLEVTTRAETLQPIYGNSKWREGGHTARLRDIPGSEPTKAVRFPVLGTTKATQIKWKEVGLDVTAEESPVT